MAKRDEPVRLTRIYTRGGDRGETSLGDGSRVPKTDPRIVATGDVDELNSAIGLAIAADGAPRELLDAGRTVVRGAVIAALVGVWFFFSFALLVVFAFVALGTTARGARNVEPRSGGGAAGQDEALQHRQLGVQLVDGAEGGDPLVELRDAREVAEVRLAGVAGARVDPREADGLVAPA